MVAREGATDKVWCAWYAWSWRRCTAARAAGGGCEEGVVCVCVVCGCRVCGCCEGRTSSAVGGMGPMSSCGRRGAGGYRAGCQGGAAMGVKVVPRCCRGGYSRRVQQAGEQACEQAPCSGDRAARGWRSASAAAAAAAASWGRCSPAPRSGPSAAWGVVAVHWLKPLDEPVGSRERQVSALRGDR